MKKKLKEKTKRIKKYGRKQKETNISKCKTTDKNFQKERKREIDRIKMSFFGLLFFYFCLFVWFKTFCFHFILK